MAFIWLLMFGVVLGESKRSHRKLIQLRLGGKKKTDWEMRLMAVQATRPLCWNEPFPSPIACDFHWPVNSYCM